LPCRVAHRQTDRGSICVASCSPHERSDVRDNRSSMSRPYSRSSKLRTLNPRLHNPKF
jgi:hypothetical protein